MTPKARSRLILAAGAIVVLGAIYVGIKVALAGPAPSSVISIISDFPLESGGPTVAAFDAVQSHVDRFGGLPSTKEYIATIHKGRASDEVSCYTVTVSADNQPALYLLQVTNATLEVQVSLLVGGSWEPSGPGRATECESLEPAPST